MADALGKLLPRNLAAFRAGADPAQVRALVPGNPASTLLESGVGNCFPGLEFDMRNLERRFFPFLEVDTDLRRVLQVAAVDLAGAQAAAAAGTIDAATLAAYQTLAAATGWSIRRMAGDFGPLGMLDFDLGQLTFASMGQNRLPTDGWTAIRLLKEQSVVTLSLVRQGGQTARIAGRRNRYLDPNGALSTMFAVGELSQSLCSPWTHDFRDCGCYYWATNHPDIALPPLAPAGPPQPSDNVATPWLRADRTSNPPPAATATVTAATPPEIPHNAINRSWQELAVVLERRERVTPYAEEALTAAPLANQPTLVAHLRFAAGVELALMQEYLAAAWSLKLAAGAPEPLRGDLRAAFYEVLQVAIDEMRHLRAVNEVLQRVQGIAYTPALQVATQIPVAPGQTRPQSFRALTPAALADFIQVEAPSQSVDSLYARILVTLEAMPKMDAATQSIRTIMSEGSDHWESFKDVGEWLGRHAPAAYLRATVPANAALATHRTLQTRYAALLDKLHAGYAKGLPAGAADVNAARTAMFGNGGIEGALEAVAATGALPHFEPIADPRFSPAPPPP